MAYEASGIGANGCNEIVPNAMKWLPGSERLSPKTTTLGKSPANADGANKKNSRANGISTRRQGRRDILLMMFILGLLLRHRRFGRLRSVGVNEWQAPCQAGEPSNNGLLCGSERWWRRKSTHPATSTLTPAKVLVSPSLLCIGRFGPPRP